MMSRATLKPNQTTEAVRAAVVHIAFNILGVVVWLPFLGVLLKHEKDLAQVSRKGGNGHAERPWGN